MGMLADPSSKYKAFTPLKLSDRTWPEQTITKPPRWLSSDLRDGNQALVNPMSIEQKTRFFNLLVKCGYKEIEVAYPAASDTDFNFVRMLVDKQMGVKEGVWIQVLSPAREDLIRRTFEAVKGAPRVIFHMYNACSPCFRQVVFGNSKEQTVELATKHIKLIRELVDESIARGDGTDWQLEYSPETFSQTEPEFAYHICNQVQDIWFAGKDKSKMHPIIFNLPATVEISTPNHYADQIEFFCRNIKDRQHVAVSLHCHNDRGCATAATELGIMAGADRVEGCLFGNGERTGNVDLVNLALNLYTQGINPNVDLSNIEEIIECVKYCNELDVHPRHPYGGELVFTAFSGSHQDAIKKALNLRKKNNGEGFWEIPYLPIDPADIGCTYEAIIRVNSQSGKGGVSYLVQQALQIDMPRRMQVAFYKIVQEVADRAGKEMSLEDVEKCFRTAYHYGEGYDGRFGLLDYSLSGGPDMNSFSKSPTVPMDANPLTAGKSRQRHFNGTVKSYNDVISLHGIGNGPISSLLDALEKQFDLYLDVKEYSESAIGTGSNTRAASFVELVDKSGRLTWGVGVDVDVTAATLQAVLSAASGASQTDDELADEIQEKMTGLKLDSGNSHTTAIPIPMKKA